MRRETQNVLLVLLGGALLKMSFTGTYLNYVKPGHLWLLVTGGVVMIALAAVSIGRDVISARRTAPANHHHHSVWAAWLLLLPVFAVFLVAPGALGADSVQRSSGGNNRAAASAPAEDDDSALFPALPQGDVIAIPLSDFSARAAWDTHKSVHDRKLRLTGFVVHDGKDVYLARLAITCCAADAFPVKVKLVGDGLSGLTDDSWVEVVATFRPGSSTRENGHVPAVDVDSVGPVAEPADPYEH